MYRDSLFDDLDLSNLKSTISHQGENVKLWVCIVFIFVAALTLNAQNPDPVGQGLLDQAKADQDSFGAGPDGSKRPTLEERAINAQSTLVLERSGIPWISPEESTPSLVGTTEGAEAYFDRALANSDVVSFSSSHPCSVNVNHLSFPSINLIYLDMATCSLVAFW